MAKDVLKMDMPEGTVIKVTDAKGLTDLERRYINGEDISAVVQKSIPKDLQKSIENAKAALNKEGLDRITSVVPKIGKQVDVKELSPEEQARVQSVLKQMKLDGEGINATEELTAINTSKQELPDELKVPEDITTPKEEVASESITEMHYCPNCAWDQSKTPDKLDPADKEEWLRCLLGQRRFSKTYSLAGGKLKVTFRTRNMEEQQAINTQLIRDNETGVIPSYPINLSMASHNARLQKLNLTVSLVNVSGMRGNLPDILSEEAKKLYGDGIDDKKGIVAVAADRIFAKWHEALFTVIFKQFTIFDDLCYRLAEAAASPDFWKEADV